MPKSSANKNTNDDSRQLKKSISRLESELRQKSDFIQAQQSKLDTYFNSSIDAMVQMDFEGRITGWNGPAEKIFGWTSKEILGSKLEESIIPQRYREAHINGLAKFLDCGEESVINTLIEFHALHRNGHEFPVELSISHIDTPEIQEFNAPVCLLNSIMKESPDICTEVSSLLRDKSE